MLEIEDNISIIDDNLIYYQLDTGEQLDEKTEKTLNEVVYDAGLDKSNNQKLVIDENQTEQQRLEKTKWIMTINSKQIFLNYLFATLKKFRTFEGVTNDMVLTNNLNRTIFDYIINNVYYRYRFVRMELFLLPIDITSNGNLQFSNQFDPFIKDDITKVTKFQTVLSEDESSIRVFFSQPENASEFSFKYYYNLYFEKL
jgi:hypothetical protein